VLNDLSLREKLILVPLVIVIIWLGIFPQPILNAAKPSIDQIQREQSTTVSLKNQSSIEKKQRGGPDE
jgi:NADH-quinone oxidoreductase subunit M